MTPALVTERLVLRQWRSSDLPSFAALNADAEVMAHFPAPLDHHESDALADRIASAIAVNGWGLWAVERRSGGDFIGFTGLSRPRFEASFTPCVEVGWRLARTAWGHGYAQEAARAALAFGWTDLGLDEIVSFTSVGNQRSRAVMERLGMRRTPPRRPNPSAQNSSGNDLSEHDFENPMLPPGHRLRPHVLYRVARPSEPPDGR